MQHDAYPSCAELDALLEADNFGDARHSPLSEGSMEHASLDNELRRHFYARASPDTPAYTQDTSFRRAVMAMTYCDTKNSATKSAPFESSLLDDLCAQKPQMPLFQSNQEQLEALVQSYTNEGNMETYRQTFGDDAVRLTSQQHSSRLERTRLSMFCRSSARPSFFPRQSTRASVIRLTEPQRPLTRQSTGFANGVDRILDAPGAQQTPCLRQLAWCDAPNAPEILGIALTEHLYAWDPVTATAHYLLTVQPRQERISCLSWRPQAPHIVFSDKSGVTTVFDASGRGITQAHALPSTGHQKHTVSHAWMDDTLLAGLSDGSLAFLDLRAGKWIKSVRCSDTNSALAGLACAPRPNDHWVAVGTSALPDADDAALSQLKALEQKTQTLPSGKAFAAEPDKAVQILDVRSLGNFIDSKSAVASLRTASSTTAFAWDRQHPQRLLTGSRNGYLCTWDIKRSDRLLAIDTGRAISAVALNAPYNEVLTTHYGFPYRPDCFQQLHLWSLDRFAPITPFGKFDAGAEAAGEVLGVLDAALSPSGQTVCALTGDELLKFWHVFPNDV